MLRVAWEYDTNHICDHILVSQINLTMLELKTSLSVLCALIMFKAYLYMYRHPKSPVYGIYSTGTQEWHVCTIICITNMHGKLAEN